MIHQRVGPISPLLPPHVEMPQIDEWEQKLLGDLAGTVHIEPWERTLLARSFSWLCRRPREEDVGYESCIHDNWPDLVGQGSEVEEAVQRCANLPSRYSHGGSASVPSGSSSLGAALTLTAMRGSSLDRSIENLHTPVPSDDEAHHLASVGDDLTTETEDDIKPSSLLPCLPKQLRTSLGAMPTRPDIPAPPLMKAAFTNTTKKIPKKMAQVDKVSELMKRRDDLLDYI
jgi:hypothetical protein